MFLRVAATAATAAAIVSVGGGGEAFWLSVPLALLAATQGRGRLGSALAALIVVVGAAVPAWIGPLALPSLPLAFLVAGGSVAVLVVVRERLERERDLLRRFALSDPLTRVSNRRGLLGRADYEIARHQRAGRSFALVMLDLDGFKALNDRFGHPAGDDLLRLVATALKRSMRAQDTIARLGGDEFCVLAPETDESGTSRLAARVEQAITEVSIGVESIAGSLGIAMFPADGTTAPDLIQAADQRLLVAKRDRHAARGRGRGRDMADRPAA